jgi:hypothetical protein
MPIRLTGLPFLVLAAIALAPRDANAQRRSGSGSFIHGPVEAGFRVGRDFGNHAWLVGAQVRVPVGRNLELRPSGDLVFPRSEGMGWQLNGDAAIRFGSGSVYAGGGIALVHPKGGDTNDGYNLFFGVGSPDASSRWKPFLEFRWTFINDTSPFRLMLGFNHQL